MKTETFRSTSMIVLSLAAALAFALAPRASGQCGGCGGHDHKPAANSPAGGTAHQHPGSARGAAPAINAAATAALAEPAKSVFGGYLQIHGALAGDSAAGVADHAAAIAAAIRADPNNTFPPQVAQQADVLAQAKDLGAAREAFKPLSRSLAQYATANKLTGRLVVVYCPMAKGSWLQSDRNVANPYYGASMLKCGEIVQ
ncbi:MAG: DUF3347 domain-containing protein [Verrucomicrobia bacterium]|nr:DUF3347 domain-containing protein [Verrucomicrobiota bacterium]